MHYKEKDKESDKENDKYSTIEIEDSNLRSYFGDLGTKKEEIEKVEIFKNNLTGFPIVAGAWHEFTVVESTSWFWSFEKQDYGICVQRSKDKLIVKDKFRGKDRKGSVKDEGRAAQLGRYGETIYDIFNWIYKNDFVIEGYHITKKNCHYFASLLFEAIARQEGRRL
jgi:hypothetical protein